MDDGDFPAGAYTPRTLAAASPVSVIVKLTGNPVALAQASAGRKLTAAEKQAVRDQLAKDQAALAPQIQALGGQVVNHYSDAINGLRVRIDGSKIDALKQLPGVAGVSRIPIYQPLNVNGVPLIQAPGAWSPFAGMDGFRGEGVKIAIIDTGIDYTHMDFGGPGTIAAFLQAKATSTLPADPTMFGPGAPKVKGGTDLVGDDYNASSKDPAKLVPHPDPNPLDCFGHGTHVAGTAAGFGVLTGGLPYSGPYDTTTYTGRTFEVGPGVAPHADLYAVRVFGCAGSTDVVIDALDWAVANDMDVVNMSLGSDFGGADTADAEASDNAVQAGVVVVAAAGNGGAIRYISGSPAASSSTIAVAADDPTASFPGVILTSGTTTVTTIDANGASIAGIPPLPVKVLRNADGTVSLGCNRDEYIGTTGMLVVTARGNCARVARAIFGQQHGAAAVLMINNANGLPPYEGSITSNPDDGEQYIVTIPFLGASGTAPIPATVAGLDGKTVTLSATTIANPSFKAIASFSSQGPRSPDAHLKPDVTAPGVSIRSAGIGTGFAGVFNSGTSMATPHVAGLAALARQAHPAWPAAAIKNAIMNTASPADVVNYATSRAGAGLANAAAAAHTQAVAFADTAEVSLSFGALEMQADFSKTKTIRVKNNGSTDVTFNVTNERMQGSPHQVALSTPTLTVPAGQTAGFDITVTIPAATAGSSSAFREAAGLAVLTPVSGNNGVALRVPYYAVLRPSARVSTTIAPKLSTARPTGTATVTNSNGAIAGNADFYAWGLDGGSVDKAGYVDIRAVGAQSFPSGTSDALVAFAVNMNQMWNTPELLHVELPIDVDGDGQPDYVVIGADFHFFNGAASFDGRVVSAVYNVKTKTFSVKFLASAPTNSSTILLPFLASQIGVTAAHPRFAYTAAAFDLASNDSDSVNQTAVFNPFTNAISTGGFVSVAPNATAQVPLSLNLTEWPSSPALGTMVVNIDNKSGAGEADLIAVSP